MRPATTRAQRYATLTTLEQIRTWEIDPNDPDGYGWTVLSIDSMGGILEQLLREFGPAVDPPESATLLLFITAEGMKHRFGPERVVVGDDGTVRVKMPKAPEDVIRALLAGEQPG